MKKYLFSAVSVLAFFAYQAKAQQATLTVKPDTNVKVMNGALLYVNGEMKVEDYSNNSNKKVSNSGKIKITTKLTNDNATTGANFINEYNEAGSYGQLIVSNGSSNPNAGRISSGVKAKSGYSFLPLALPYSGITGASVVTDLFGADKVADAFPGYVKGSDKVYGFDENRLKNALFFWENDKYMFTQVGKDENLGVGNASPARYYAVNTMYSGAGIFQVGQVKHIKGTPVKDEVSVTVTKTDLSHTKSTDRNDYGEAYGSYIYDFTMAMPTGWNDYYKEDGTGYDLSGSDFGSRIYNFGNPFTSNINLFADGTGLPKDQIEALVQYGNQTYTETINSATASGAYGGTFSTVTGDGAGDNAYLGIVPPFGTFAVKMKKTMPQSVIFTFNDAMKTFEGPKANASSAVNTMFAKSNGSMPVVNQVGLDLYDANEQFTGAKTYVVASDIYEASHTGEGVEIYNPMISDKDTGIYTLQEKEDGTVDEKLANNRTYINGINADKYIAKPVYLVIQNGKGKYTLKARLNETLENNKNTFYFEDKATGKVEKVGKDFSYTFDVNGTEKDRFVLYWAATPKSEKVEEVAKQEVNATVVFKDADTYKVRFDRGIRKADVFVYNISGQLVNTAKNIDASEDYIVPLKGNSAVYVLKIVGDNGKVTTKKIIK